MSCDSSSTNLAVFHGTTPADEVDHADGLVRATVHGRVSSVTAGGVPHAPVTLVRGRYMTGGERWSVQRQREGRLTCIPIQL